MCFFPPTNSLGAGFWTLVLMVPVMFRDIFGKKKKSDGNVNWVIVGLPVFSHGLRTRTALEPHF